MISYVALLHHKLPATNSILFVIHKELMGKFWLYIVCTIFGPEMIKK